MSLKTVCRLCLAMDAPMHNIANSPLQDVYQKLTNISLNLECRPAVACYICYGQLRKSHNLMVRSVRADRVLSRILQSGGQLKEESIAILNHEAYQHPLNISPMKVITLTGTENDLVKVDIKEEPLAHYDEVETLTIQVKLEEAKDEDLERDPGAEDIGTQGTDLGDVNEEELDPLAVIPVEFINTKGTVFRNNNKLDGVGNMRSDEYKGAVPAEKSKKTRAGKLEQSTPTPRGKNIQKKLTRCRPANKDMSNIGNKLNTNTNVFQCEICQRKFTRRGDLNKHLRIHSMEKRFECEICKDRFAEMCSLKIHLRKHTGEKPYECEMCKAKFSVRANLRRHLRIHTGEKPYECEICKVRFIQKVSLTAHLATHTGEKSYECNVCKLKFNQNANLKTHLRVHTGEKPYECEICKVRFSMKRALKAHYTTHTRDKIYECDICKVRFSHKVGLKIHLRIHTGEKPYQCEICKTRFTVRANLKRHLRTHTGEKPYQCQVCKVRFAQNGTLKAHLRIHTGEKPYECEICKFKFSARRTLQSHLRTHLEQDI